MKVEANLQLALRNNLRRQQLPTMLDFISNKLGVPIEQFEVPSLNYSDKQLDVYRRNIRGAAKNGDIKKRFNLKLASEVTFLLETIRLKIPDEQVLLFSAPMCECCGAIITQLHLFLTKAIDLVLLNSNAVYVVSSDAQNCIDLTYDTKYGTDGGEVEYVLNIKGNRYISLLK